MFDLVLGTHNAKIRTELQLLLPEDKIRLWTLADFPDAVEVEETGSTFAENAALKATEQARAIWIGHVDTAEAGVSSREIFRIVSVAFG